MKIELKKITLRNFKGIRDLIISFNGNTNIFGANESGKSTIYTAFTWLLTGKDEFDRKDYEIKNTNKKELNSQAHEVEALLLVNGREEKLKRVYLEKWTKQRGQSTKVFEGHKTDFYYNDVPCNATEYQAKVDAIIDGKIIKLVTNPTYFNSLKWDDQRRGLTGIAVNITDTDVFDAIATPQNDYGTLIMILNSGKTAEEYKKEIAAKKTLLKKAAIEFQPRIDEVKRSRPEELNWSMIETQIEEKQNHITQIEIILSDASKALSEKQRGLMAKQKQLHAKQTDLANIRFKIKSDLLSKQNDGAGEIEKVARQIQDNKNEIALFEKKNVDKETTKLAWQKQIEEKNEIITTLRNDWNKINAEKFEFDESKCECPTCHQTLPPLEIEAQKIQLQTNFNENVSQRKKSKVDYSNIIKNEIAQLQRNIAEIEKADYSEQISFYNNAIEVLTNKFTTLKQSAGKKQVDDIETAVDALMALNSDALNLRDDIEQIETDMKFHTEALGGETYTDADKLRKQTLQIELNDLGKQLAIRETILKIDLRISQLEEEEQVNAQAIADLERQEFEVETYTRAKMDILEKRVNSMFHYVRFRLFEIQVNGGITETCVCEYNGVPYPTLNTAAKLLAGLDVLETLSNFYKVHAPVFCDNRESVSWIPECKSQIISLFVSPEDKKLRIESRTNKLEFANN